MALADDLAWWKSNRTGPESSELRLVLDRLRAWKAEHDTDRARQPGPFFKMVWDGIFADDESAVSEAIAEIEAALGPH